METDRADKDRPRIQVVDYVYKVLTLPHTNLTRPIAYCDSKRLKIQKEINININMFLISISILML